MRKTNRRAGRFCSYCGVLWLAALHASAAAAGAIVYQYDVHGRLTAVVYDDGMSVTYAHDAAGNRTQVVSSVDPPAPATLDVPPGSTTGNYTISWSASATNVNYELYEASSGSVGEIRVYNGAGTAVALTNRAAGTYYYRIRACNAFGCSPYRAGSNAITVMLPPAMPASITVPASSGTGSYTINWGVASGAVDAYELYESTSSSFSAQVRMYSGAALSAAFSGRSNGSYYYRVRACNGIGCSAYRSGDHAITVSLTPPAPPSSISASGTPRSGRYSVYWSASTGANRFELWESVFGGGYSKVYDGPNNRISYFNKPAGEYRYKAKACNGIGCSAFSAIKFVMVCNPTCF